MQKTDYALGDCTFEILTDGDRFIGIGQIHIGPTLVRSGRLPLQPYSQAYEGFEIASLKFLGVDKKKDSLRLKIEAGFRPLEVKLMRDHSFDPIHELGDWDDATPAKTGRIDIVLKLAREAFEPYTFTGFSYHYEYSGDVKLFYIYDRASWEIDGDIEGATIVSQSSCSDPLVTVAKDTAWTTEGVIYWAPELYNKNMTHNLPRWASHQAFDFQHKGNHTLIGVFDHVDLIRTTLVRDAGKPELKTFDKHIFDAATSYKTSPKKILLNSDRKTETQMQNLWTWIIDEIHDRARAEFGMKEVPTVPRLSQNYWVKFTIDTYYRDLLPCAINLGFKELFVDNLNKSDMTEESGKWNGNNMCCGQEYETAPFLGGPEKLKVFIDRCKEHGIRVMSWTNNDQSHCSPIFSKHRNHTDKTSWFVHMEDTRISYGGAYTDGFAILDFKNKEPREYWINSLKKIKKESGLDGYLFDSFYNLGFMPVNYADGRCSTQWREVIHAFKELQDSGIEFLIESFGPWGQPQHGCPRSYSIDRAWVVYKVGLGNDYTTVPTGKTYEDPRQSEAASIFYALAHKVSVGVGLFKDGKRLDEIWTEMHKQALRDYHASRIDMHKRFLQEDGQSVLWHDKAGKRATIWSFADQKAKLPGTVVNVTTGEKLAKADSYKLKANQTYAITGAKLPVALR